MLQNQGTVVVNGQLIGAIPGPSQYVTGFAPASALGPSGPLTIPPTIGGGTTAGTLTGTADSNAQAVQNAKADPFNPKVSPVLPALLMLVIALVALHLVHFRETASESSAAASHVDLWGLAIVAAGIFLAYLGITAKAGQAIQHVRTKAAT